MGITGIIGAPDRQTAAMLERMFQRPAEEKAKEAEEILCVGSRPAEPAQDASKRSPKK